MRIISYDTGVNVDNIASPVSSNVQKEEWSKARAALNSLPEIERKVVELRIENQSWVRIADNLGITLYMAKKHHKDGMKKVKKALTRY